MTASFAAISPDALNDQSIGAYAVGPEQVIRFWNPGAERILGHTSQDAIGHPCHQVLQAAPNESLPPVCLRGCPFMRLAGQGRIPPPLHTQILCASGQRKRVILTPMIILAEDSGMTLFHLFKELPGDDSPARPTGASTVYGRDAPLTGRELQTLQLMAAGLTNHEIAGSLTLSYHTVRNHVCNIRGKLQARNREQAIIIGRNLGLI